MYNGSKVIPKNGGTLSVGFVGNSPSLNPLDFGIDQNNDYILQFMYRSLLRYNFESKKMEGDLANCDLGKNFSTIKCYIKDGATWSDGNPVRKSDILETYNVLKNTDINKGLKSILNNIEVNDNGGYIEFSSKNADVLLLDAFTIPIVKKEQIESFKDSNLAQNISPITNGAFDFSKKEFDTEYNAKKITLTKSINKIYDNDYYISKIVFKFFQDKNNLLKNENTLNIIFPSDEKELLVSPRYRKYDYLFPQYIGLFLNTEKIISLDLRKAILFQLENATYLEYGESKGKKVNNPFLGDELIIPEITNKNFVSIINSLGFFKKEHLIGEINKKYDNLLKPKSTSNEIPVNTYFKTPSNKKIYFRFGGASEMLISGNVPAGVSGVYINEFKLKSFVSGNTKFYFRATSEFKTLNIGANNYTLYFEVNGKKVKKETLTVYYYQDKATLETKQKEVLDNLNKTVTVTVADTSKINAEKEIELQKVQALDNSYFYDKNYAKFTLNLNFVNEGSYFSYYAKRIKEEMQFLGIDLNIKEITQKEMQAMISKGEKNYDMLLTGVNHGLFDYNIFPFYHSSQAKIGFNFSKIKNIPLDLLLEKLKASALEEEKLKQIKKESLEILKREAVVKTFFNPYSFFYIDKNIKNIHEYSLIPYKYYSYDVIKNSYIKEDRIINYSQKGIGSFFSWLKKSF
ncbi:ABC transporter substrate-binding protein [Candidatus Gracilibacteria bacterium]|nr:ABC transporter substrate-binding protein [Candidatus Gracilibacteria bacterium]